MPWSEFYGFVQEPDALCLFSRRNYGYIIPVRAVENAAALAELADTIRAKLPDTRKTATHISL